MGTLLALVGLAVCLFLSGCAHEQAGATTRPASQPPAAPTATFTVVGVSNGAPPLSYQWQSSGTNVSGVTIIDTNPGSVRIIGSNNGGVANQ